MNTQKIMFVDDDESVRISWDRYLTGSGFTVITAETAESAMDRIRKEHVDVIVSDLRMPGIDGLQFMQIVKREYPHIQFIMLTGFGDSDIEAAVADGGGFGYISKPIAPEIMEEIILSAFNKIGEIDNINNNIKELLDQTDIPKKHSLVRTAEVLGGLIISPILGLAFVVFLPTVGFAAIVYSVGEHIRYHILHGDHTTDETG